LSRSHTGRSTRERPCRVRDQIRSNSRVRGRNAGPARVGVSPRS
jgi:hypothetical protein